MKLRLTIAADRDIEHILAATYRLFGRNQLVVYSEIIKRGLSLVAEEPYRASSHDRSDLRAGIRSFHLQLAARRQGGAAHVLFYRVMRGVEADELVIIRVLGDEMEPRNRVARALREDFGD